MTSLWDEASAYHETMAREAALALADAEMEAVMPFLLASRSAEEYVHRSALAQDSIAAIAARCGLDADELLTTARRRFELYREALADGDSNAPIFDELRRQDGGGSGFGGGPEKPDEHSEGPGPDAYSEVPPGPPRGPNPGVTAPRPPMAGPVQEATGSLRRQAETLVPPMPPDTGTGRGSVDMGLPSSSLDGRSPSLAAGGTAGNTAPITPPEIGQVTSSRDPVRRRVMAVTAAIRETNPHLPAAECERVARQVVGRYMRHADLAGSAMDDQPVGSGGGGNGGGNSGGSGGGGGGLVQKGLEWKGLRSMMPGGGGGAAADAAGAGAADLADVAAVAAL